MGSLGLLQRATDRSECREKHARIAVFSRGPQIAANLTAAPRSAAFDATRSMDVLGLQFESAFAAFESAFSMTYPRFYPQFESAFS